MTFYKVAHSGPFDVCKPHNTECLDNSSLDVDVRKAGTQPGLRAGTGAVKTGSRGSPLDRNFP